MEVLLSLFSNIKLLVVLLTISSCTLVKSYESVANKSCGQNFCSEIELKNHVGIIFITDVSGQKLKANSIEVDAHCIHSMNRAPRSKHLGLAGKRNDPIDLVSREGSWEFAASQIQEGCLFTVSVTSKKIEEIFRFVAMWKASMGPKIDTNL